MRLLALSAVLALILSPTRALACSCARPPSAQEAKQWAATVVRGVAHTVEWREEGYQRQLVASLRVDTIWKGEVPEEIVVTSDGHPGMCGFPFEQGQEYILYLGSNPEAFSASNCDRSRLATDEEARALGPPLRVLGQPQGSPVAAPGSPDGSILIQVHDPEDTPERDDAGRAGDSLPPGWMGK